MNKFILAAIAIVMLPPFLIASGTPDRLEALKRIEQAVSKTNIFELPSFRMKASISIDNNGKPLDGTYQLLWNGPDQWKEEISFPRYTEVQVGSKGTIWIKRSTDFIPFRISQVHSALGYGFGVPVGAFGDLASLIQVRVTSKDNLKKIRSQKGRDENLTCFEFEAPAKETFEICLNDITGTVARSSTDDENFQAVGEKSFPRLLSYKQDDKVVASVNISELTTPAKFVADSFAPPPGVSPQTGCMNPMPARIVKKVSPQYPQGARENQIEGTVAVDALIGTDGVPRINKVVATPSLDLGKSAVEAIKDWRYEPATCAGKAVAVETVMTARYSLLR
jgi:TonB family protein